MERAQLQIFKIRQNTNLTDRNGVSDENIMMHYNDAQKTIQSIIKQAELEPDLFVGTATVTPAGEVVADLPDTTYAINNLLYVAPTGVVRRLSKIQSYERASKSGYFLENNTIGFSEGLLLKYPSFTVKYFRRLPEVDIRRGTISAKGANSITITSPTTILPGVISDWICVVDKDGTIIQSAIRVLSYVAGVITTETAIDAAVTVGQYIVYGKVASTHTELPDECEPFLVDYIQKKIRSKNSSKETSNQALFSEEQKEFLIGLFQGNSADAIYPPMTDTDFP